MPAPVRPGPGLSRVRDPGDLRPRGRRRPVGRHVRRPRPPRAGRGRHLDRPRRHRTGAARAPAAVDHRPVRRGRPAVREGRAGAGVQRRDLQLPPAAGRAERRRGHASGPAPTPRCCWRPGGAGARRACAACAACSPSRCSTSAGARSPWPATSSASSRCSGRRADGGVAFASELKGLRPLLGERPAIDDTAIVASLMYYWIPEDHCVYQGVHKLPPGTWLEIGPDGRRRQGRFFDPRAELARAVRAASRRGGAAPRARGLGRRAPRGRRAHLHVPVRRAGLQPAHRPGRPTQPRHRLLHDLVPAGGPAPGGDARRPGLRPQAGRPARHPAARGRDRPRRGRPAPAHGRTRSTSRSATPPPSTPISSAGPPGAPG